MHGFDDKVIRELLIRAYRDAASSPDKSTRNGAYLFSASGAMIGVGVNRITASSMLTPENLERPRKYIVTEHAERDAIFNAVKCGFGQFVPESIMVATWAACADCGRAIAGCGVKVLIRHKHKYQLAHKDWLESCAAADEIMRAAGVEIIDYEGHLGVTTLFGGQMVEV
jgi:dCMP deaminase